LALFCRFVARLARRDGEVVRPRRPKLARIIDRAITVVVMACDSRRPIGSGGDIDPCVVIPNAEADLSLAQRTGPVNLAMLEKCRFSSQFGVKVAIASSNESASKLVMSTAKGIVGRVSQNRRAAEG